MRSKEIALYRDSTNIAFTPMKDGKALDETEFAQLPEAERERYHEDISALEVRLNEELASLPQWKRESTNQLRQLNDETISQALQPLLAPLSEKYAENAGIEAYLQAVQVNLLKTVVEQLVDENRPEAQNRVLLEEQYSPSGGRPPGRWRRAGGVRAAPDLRQPVRPYRIRHRPGRALYQLPPAAPRRPASRQWRLSCWRPRSCSASPSSGRRSSAPCNRAS